MNGIGEVPVTQDERTMGTLAHVLQIVGGWLAPLIIFFVKRDSKFVSFHALQALFFQLIYMVIWGGMVVIFMFTIIASVATNGGAHSNQPPTVLFVFFPLIWLAGIGGWVTIIVIAIVYGIKAGRGEWAKYPVIGNWVVRILKLEVNPAAPSGM